MKKLTEIGISIILWLAAALMFLFFGSLLILFSFVVSFKSMQPMPRWVSRLVLLAAGQHIRVINPMPRPDDGPYLYMFNHASMLDTLILIAIIPEYSIAIGKAEQFKWPIWGLLIRRWGAVPIHRDDLNRAISQLDEVSSCLSQGISLVISPEGTRSVDGRLQAFKKGPFHLAMKQPTSIVPIAIIGAHRGKQRGEWILRPNVIEIRVGAIIPPDSDAYKSREQLSEATRQAIENGLPTDQRAISGA